MPELPEIATLAGQIDKELAGKMIAEVEVRQPKCLNLAPEEMSAFLRGRVLKGSRGCGKWLFIDLDPPGHLLINLGMGGDLLYGSDPEAGAQGPESYQFAMEFTDGTKLTARFWWFGHVHAVAEGTLGGHTPTASLGPPALDPDLSLERFREMVTGKRRSRVKTFLLDQKNLSGIGNVYVQDSLWEARLHPNRLLGSLTDREVEALFASLRGVLQHSLDKGGLEYEKDLFGRPGGYGRADFAVAYKEGEPCPACGTIVEKIRTGGTSTYICPECQIL